MRKILKKYFPIIPVLCILVPAFFSNSCANTTESPSGGAKDTIPPVLTKVEPQSGCIGVPLTGAVLKFTFNEYVNVKNPKNIFLSPPQKKAPKYKIHGKRVDVYFEEPLDSNTTYTIEFTDAIADVNEGNMFPGFTYVFSTGEQIDSMMITGTVVDCNTLKQMKGVTVMLYKDHRDSAFFQQRPYAATKTDEWGYFCIRNIQDTLYRLYALKDGNDNNIFDPSENELVAFVDSLIRPVTVVNDSLPELAKYDMKDTLSCLARKSEYELGLFREKPRTQMIVNKVRVADRTSYITFMAPNAHIDSMWMRGVPADRLITQFNIQRDSLEIWVNDRKAMPDTFHLYVNYRKTDTLGKLKPFLEHVKLFVEGAPKKSAASKSSRKDIKHEDTICVYTLKAEPERVEQYGYELEFKYPIVYEKFDSLILRSVSPKQKDATCQFTVEPDTLNLRKFTIRPKDKLLPGYEYFLKLPFRAFRDINGFYSDSTEVKVMLPNDEKLSTLTLDLTGVHNKYIVDLLNDKKTSVLRSYIIDRDRQLVFPYLKEGKYSIRITEDVNRNSIVDSGSLLDHRQPEKVKFYKIKDSDQIEIMEMSEISQEVNLSELFAK